MKHGISWRRTTSDEPGRGLPGAQILRVVPPSPDSTLEGERAKATSKQFGDDGAIPRMLIVVAAVNRPLLFGLALPLGAMAVAGYALALFAYFRGSTQDSREDVPFRNPFELKRAVEFCLIYGVVLFVARAAQEYVGTTGVYASAALAGLADVDAITLSLAELHRAGAIGGAAVPAIALAALVNTLVKAGLATLVGGKALGRRVAPVLLGTLVVGGVALVLGAALRR